MWFIILKQITEVFVALEADILIHTGSVIKCWGKCSFTSSDVLICLHICSFCGDKTKALHKISVWLVRQLCCDLQSGTCLSLWQRDVTRTEYLQHRSMQKFWRCSVCTKDLKQLLRDDIDSWKRICRQCVGWFWMWGMWNSTCTDNDISDMVTSLLPPLFIFLLLWFCYLQPVSSVFSVCSLTASEQRETGQSQAEGWRWCLSVSVCVGLGLCPATAMAPPLSQTHITLVSPSAKLECVWQNFGWRCRQFI